jgi:enoyl-CoA hydratase/carnithine racemase
MEIEPRFYKVEKDGPIVIWKFDNPPQNMATLETSIELISLVEAFDQDPELRVGIVTSATPGKFIQHFDVSVLLSWAETMQVSSEEEIQELLAALPPPQSLRDHTSKPVICAINGPVEGGGCEMALGCDFRFISRDAYMGQPEVGAGFIPGGGGTQHLARLVGVGRAMELCMTGRTIAADEAERLGLAVAACEPEELASTVMAFAHDLAAKPQMAIANIKRAIHQGSSMPLHEGLVLERKLFFECLCSEEAIALMRLYVAAGQDRDKVAAIVEEAGGDPDKIAELLGQDTG